MAVAGRLLKAAKPDARSRVTNGSALLPGVVDQRSVPARRYRDLVSLIIADQGGIERMSELRLQLIRRFAAQSVQAKSMEADLANGKTIDVAQHSLLCSTLVRLAQRIGIDRRSKDITPLLRDYLEEKTVDAEATG